MYDQKKYDKIVDICQSWNSYNSFQINDHKLIFFLISEQNNDLIKNILVNNKIKSKILNDDDNKNSFYPLTFSILNNLNVTTEILIENSADIKRMHKDGNSQLHLCSYYKRGEQIQYLLDKGLLLNEQNDRGDTPLHLAAIQGHIDIIQQLLQLKANTDIENIEFNLPIHEAVLMGNFEAYKLLKPFYKGQKNNTKQTHIIHLASILDSSDILLDLIGENKALVNLRDEKNKATPLHYSVSKEQIQCTQILLENGALVDVQDKVGNTPIHIAVENKSVELCKELCKYNADPTIENQDKLNAIDLAEGERDKELISFFKSLPKLSNYFGKQ